MKTRKSTTRSLRKRKRAPPSSQHSRQRTPPQLRRARRRSGSPSTRCRRSGSARSCACCRAPIAPPAAEPPATTVASPTPVFTPHPPRDSHERRGFDPKRGRRRRHRGRPEFGEHRPADRKFAPPTRTEEPPTEAHSFESCRASRWQSTEMPARVQRKKRQPNTLKVRGRNSLLR